MDTAQIWFRARPSARVDAWKIEKPAARTRVVGREGGQIRSSPCWGFVFMSSAGELRSSGERRRPVFVPAKYECRLRNRSKGGDGLSQEGVGAGFVFAAVSSPKAAPGPSRLRHGSQGNRRKGHPEEAGAPDWKLGSNTGHTMGAKEAPANDPAGLALHSSRGSSRQMAIDSAKRAGGGLSWWRNRARSRRIRACRSGRVSCCRELPEIRAHQVETI